MKYSLWIADKRNPDQQVEPPRDALLLWARDGEQAKFYVRRHGVPHTLYLDHDLGENETVMEFLRWLERLGYDPTFDYVVISANPDGRKAIISFIDSWKRIVSEAYKEGESCQ